MGQFIRPVTPGSGIRLHVFRCTTAGTSAGTEPNWNGAPDNNNTIATGTATFTNVAGQSAYGWSAAAGSLWSISAAINNRAAAGDRIFLSSDHSESVTTGNSTIGFVGVSAFGLVQVISVNRAGSVPPVAADILSGASITGTVASFGVEAYTDVYWQGITLAVSSGGNFLLNVNTHKEHYFKNCSFSMTGKFLGGGGGTSKAVLDNTTIQFSSAVQLIGSNGAPFELVWINTPSALAGATFPTTLFNPNSAGMLLVTCRGVDLSALTGTLAISLATGGGAVRILLDSCRIASGLTRYGTPGSACVTGDEVELVNCFDGTNILNERYTAAGALTTERSTTLSGGAQDDVGAYSLKLVSSTRSDKQTLTLDSFWLDVENTITGASKTATVEIISSASLNNDDIQLMLEYMGTSGSSLASFGNSLATVLTASAALTTSSATWNNPPSTPVKQLLQITFTPQVAGRVRGLVRLGKISTTVWVNPQIAIT